jgi:ubiquinone/menaquinone biosynthesis C-methylase UbiE/dienelactone hydrolase
MSRDHRAVHRVPCRIAVTAQGRGAPLGETRDLSLAGAFIATRTPLQRGLVVPITLVLAEGEVQLQAEVVRTSDEGVGLRFQALGGKAGRVLRRHVAQLTDVVGTRRAVGSLLEAQHSVSQPIEDTETIRDLLRGDPEAPPRLTLIPETRDLRVEVGLLEQRGDELVLRGSQRPGLRAGDEVLGLHTQAFVSYFFRSQVLRVEGPLVVVRCPSLLHYSERRGDQREDLEGAVLELPLPWSSEPARWPICEASRNGLSFRADPATFVGLPGTPLEGASLVLHQQGDALQSPVIKHVTLVDEETPWLRVGVSHGIEQARAQAAPLVDPSAGAETLWARLWSSIKAGLGLVWHGRLKPRSAEDWDRAQLVTLRNTRGQRLAGLLDRSFPSDEPVRMPVVIVVPGYAGRKEQSCALAKTLVHNFRRHHRELAVLRLDGTNNLGESEKDPGCDSPGRECLRYTVSGVASDLLGALAWVQDNPWFEATEVMVVSVSFGSIGVRRALTRPEAAGVAEWVAFRGAPDAQNAVLHVSGNVDLVGNYLRGMSSGIVSLVGRPVDADHFCGDLADNGGGTLDDAKQDLARIPAAVTWILGASDAWMDPERARELMAVAGAADREVLQMPGGHTPQNSEAALEEFRAITELAWARLYDLRVGARAPGMGWVAALSEQEWARVRREPLPSPTAWWRDYLLGDEGPGFDVLTLSEAYTDFIELQAELLEVGGQRALDLGTGTGNLAQALAARGPSELQCIDLVPEALERARTKLDASVTLLQLDLEGSPRVAMKRWVAGDLHALTELSRRLPGLHIQQARRIAEKARPELQAMLRGRDADLASCLKASALPPSDGPLLSDLQLLSRVALGRVPAEEARSSLKRLPPEVLSGSPGLPFPDGHFDRVSLSLVLSYLDHPRDVLFEARRVLRPGGLLLASSMTLDADSSKLFTDLIGFLESAPQDQLPPGSDRQTLLKTARGFLDHASELFRCVEEGLFRFYRPSDIRALLQVAGFEDVRLREAFGEPHQAVIAVARKPGVSR